MIFELVVEPSAALDIADADAHYAQFDKADTFLSAIDVVFEQMSERVSMATRGSTVPFKVPCCTVKGFSLAELVSEKPLNCAVSLSSAGSRVKDMRRGVEGER